MTNRNFDEARSQHGRSQGVSMGVETFRRWKVATCERNLARGQTSKPSERDEALRESEREFRAFFENAAVGAVLLGPDGHFLRVNDRYCEIAGYTREELLAGMTPLGLSHPEDRAQDQECMAAVMAGQAVEMEKRVVRKDGTIAWLHVASNAVRDPAGRILSAVIAQDITERKRAEEALGASQKLLETIIDAAPS